MLFVNSEEPESLPPDDLVSKYVKSKSMLDVQHINWEPCMSSPEDIKHILTRGEDPV